ncbi:MAG: hypothetical protein H7338_16380 [Candidatus Sericytochromatia bacterium]|nr:hypothetical protein [Candidatus Sericytochromatia bacterium]
MNRHFDPDQSPPGPKTDLLLLHHVFDWKPGIAAFGQAAYVVPVKGGGISNEPILWPVSVDWAYAQKAIGLLEGRGFHINVAPDSPSGFVVRITCVIGAVESRAETPALAFTRAALKGVVTCLIVKN